MMALSMLDKLRLAGYRVTRHGDRLRVQPPDLPAGLLAEVKAHKADVLAALAAEEALGLPLKPPHYEVPPEWRPAPDWTPEEAVVWSATAREMAARLSDAELLDWCRSRFGARFYIDPKGHLRAEGAADVPMEVRAEVRERQKSLVALIEETT
jgi:hypothetical protein